MVAHGDTRRLAGVAENGFLQLDDNTPGLGLTLKTDYLDQFNITE